MLTSQVVRLNAGGLFVRTLGATKAPKVKTPVLKSMPIKTTVKAKPPIVLKTQPKKVAPVKPVKIALPKGTVKTAPKQIDFGPVSSSSGPVVTGGPDAPVLIIQKPKGPTKLDKVGKALSTVFDRLLPPPAPAGGADVSYAGGSPTFDETTGGIGQDVGATVGGGADSFANLVSRHSGAILLVAAVVTATVVLPKLAGGGKGR